MKYYNEHMEDIQIAYIGGGSRGWAWTFMTDLAMEPAISGTIRLYDIDRGAAKSNEIIGNAVTERQSTPGKWRYCVKDSLADALAGADFVVISILPGTFDEMETDVHLPERLGIYQSVGDTAGPGGMMRALRTLPMFLEFANAIKKYCPDAWVINYTNPMSLCVKALYEAFPQIKAFGCCHEVFGTQKVLAGIAEAELGLQYIDRRDIHVNVLGINHFTWFDYASYQGIDLFPVYKRYIDAHFEEGFLEKDTNWVSSTFGCRHRVKMDLFRRYGLIAAAGDRHLAEFMPGNEYLKDPDTVASWKFNLTSVSWRKQDLQERLARSHRLLAGSVPEPVRELLMPHIANHERIMQTVLTGSIREQQFTAGAKDAEYTYTIPMLEKSSINIPLVTEAFMDDPLVKGRVSGEEVHRLVTDMIASTL